MPAQVTYVIRRIDPEFWSRVKARTTKEGHSLRWTLLRLIELYDQVGIDKLERAANHRPRV
jgi:hypothetical protein